MSFPLHGVRLIEASAGTGKTYTIAGLYLRLLLGHGDGQSKHSNPLTVEQILVVTFTEAATEELRDRIRKRIHEARLAFLRGKTEDGFLKPFLQQTHDHQQAAQLLLDAERQMDEAAIFTIHGFCQRMLKQHAFESGASFNNELVSNELLLKSQVVADYWRQYFYSLPLGAVKEIRKLWDTPKKLLRDINAFLSGEEIHLSAEPKPESLIEIHQQNIDLIQDLKQQWLLCNSDIHDLILNSGVNKQFYKRNLLPKWIEEMNLWALSPTEDYSLPTKLDRFSQQFLSEKTTKGELATHPIFTAVDHFLAVNISLKEPTLAKAIRHCRQRLQRIKQQNQQFSFDDLLTQLSAAIEQEGDTKVLSDKIRQQYPVAMIDEFQDTDPLQYHIFSQIYLSDPVSALLMIGDPKQAIYGFRGADIFTYIEAKHQAPAHYTLATNWRSSSAMVESVNHFFSQASAPFYYNDDIPFHPVNASPGSEHLCWYLCDGESQPKPQSALNFWFDRDNDSLIGKGDYLSNMARVTGEQIFAILSKSQAGQAYLETKSGRRGIEASDIAILVRDKHQANLVKQALSEHGIPSVYLSNSESVFTSSVASDLLLMLNAVLVPENDRGLRACLACSLLSIELAELDRLNNDENVWEAAVHEFKEYHALWQQRGLLPMLRSLMSKRQIAEQLLAQEGGDRALTDLMHLGELLQQASLEVDSHYGLIHWLSQKIEDANEDTKSEEYHQRLESEHGLVQIVTIHKSKGLEYNLVFMPFACDFKSAKVAKYHDAKSNRTMLDLGGDADALAMAEQERLAEDLRLIYVAITRAVYACYVGIAPIKYGNSKKDHSDVHQSAMGYLLQNAKEGGHTLLSESLEALSRSADSISVISFPDLVGLKLPQQWQVDEALMAHEMERDIDRHWRLTSYSSLVRHSSHGKSEPISLDESGIDIDSDGEKEAELASTEFEHTIFTFPKGARPGTFLHTVFEQIDFNQPAGEQNNQQIIESLLDSEGYDCLWLPVITELVDNTLQAPLMEAGASLQHILPQQRLVEMEFLLPIELLTASHINRISHQYDSVSATAGELGFQAVKGMLKGFIDLVFEHEGQYYVLDWKSNYLGDDIQNYHKQALKQAMADHRYDLQYQIYSLALHRYLQNRLPNYQYEQHFGGVYYIFLRGVTPSSDNGIFYHKPSYSLIQEMDALFSGQPNYTNDQDTHQLELDL
ncbi:exodeoxyribonuclease V subunit beta [Vibrio sp. S4M6]|nr:exodeoxyribonuclease V subunit beta [Vibrio sinus]MCL9782225.1 exodeoxyribonuclease V subunit beta [Vibrio sinus]